MYCVKESYAEAIAEEGVVDEGFNDKGSWKYVHINENHLVYNYFV